MIEPRPFKLQVARHVGRPPQPDDAMCVVCGEVWPVKTATAWQNCEPIFVAECLSCRTVSCPVGHVIAEFFPMAALTDDGQGTVPVCITGVCHDARELISHDFEILSQGRPESPEAGVVLRRWLNYYTYIPSWHWIHCTAVQAETVSAFYARQRR